MHALLLILILVEAAPGASYVFPQWPSARQAMKVHHSLQREDTARYAGFHDQNEYLNSLKAVSQLPEGFMVGATRFSFRPFEVDKTLVMNLTIIKTDEPTDAFAAMFTSNTFCGGPIHVGRDRMRNSKELQAIVVNNKISNVCPGGCNDFGVGDSETICEKVSQQFGLLSKNLVIPSSTGIIGWRLPVGAISEAVPLAADKMQSLSILPAAIGITTTDRYPKVSRAAPEGRKWSIAGIAKGAGMIEPNMATMLAYFLTDLDLPRETLQRILRNAVNKSFNTITVDGDQSTSDTVLVLSSKKVPCEAGDEELFEEEFTKVCRELAEDIVRNGEGTQHVIKVEVSGAPTDLIARDVGRAVVNSNLVKCAVSGCDPNVGRLIGAVGDYLGKIDSEKAKKMTETMTLKLGGITIFENNAMLLDPQKEQILSDYMYDSMLYPNEVPEHERNYPTHFKTVDIAINFGNTWGGSSTVIGSDLTKEYVEVNADYRS